MVKPIFLFSLPRSGSTLVQRVLGAHPDVATVSEPWILLPFIYSMRKEGVYTKYGHHAAVKAIQDFYFEFPGGRDDYLMEMREFVLRLYEKTAVYKDERYFLDKTPRYHLIAKEIIELFPEAKFIFLWRNPLAVAASIMKSWGAENWILYRFNVDLYQGISNLVAAYEAYKDKVYSVKYEDLVSSSEAPWESMFSYLELTYHPNYLHTFNETRLRGRYGDTIGTSTYLEIDKSPLEKWESSFMNPLRKAWGKQYLQKIGKENLSTAGYNLCDLLEALKNCPKSSTHLGRDLIRMLYGIVYQAFEPQILQINSRKLG